jgi:hypothetical protein
VIVYVVHSASLRRVKIGIATDLAKRFKRLEAAYGELQVVRVFEGLDAKKLEAVLHWHYGRHRIAKPTCLEERKTGDTEWFSDRVLDTIATLDPKPILTAYRNTREYTVRLDKADVEVLRKRGMTIEDAVRHTALGARTD